MDGYINDIKNVISENGSSYTKISIESIKRIHDLFFNNIIYNPLNDIEISYLAWYYKNIKIDYDLMKKYYMMGIDKGNTNDMNHLGSYYKNIEKDYDQMKKYYLMAIDKGNPHAMNNLGWYYGYIEKDYAKMKIYFLMAIDKDDGDAMYSLGLHYEDIEKDYDLMKKYYLMAIDKGNTTAMYSLEMYYQVNDLWIEKIIDFYQRNVEITEDHVLEMFANCKMTDDKLINLIMTIDLRSYENCPKHIKMAQNYYILNIKNELNACAKCPKSLINLVTSFLYR